MSTEQGTTVHERLLRPYLGHCSSATLAVRWLYKSTIDTAIDIDIDIDTDIYLWPMGRAVAAAAGAAAAAALSHARAGNGSLAVTHIESDP